LVSAFVGAIVFCLVQVPLLSLQPAAGNGISAPGWFLNSGTNLLLVAVVLAAGAALFALAKGATLQNTLWYALGACVAMVGVLVTIGPGTIFPVVIVSGAGVVIIAVAAGTAIVGTLHKRHSHAG
jgi:hypothetical protein